MQEIRERLVLLLQQPDVEVEGSAAAADLDPAMQRFRNVRGRFEASIRIPCDTTQQPAMVAVPLIAGSDAYSVCRHIRSLVKRH